MLIAARSPEELACRSRGTASACCHGWCLIWHDHRHDKHRSRSRRDRNLGEARGYAVGRRVASAAIGATLHRKRCADRHLPDARRHLLSCSLNRAFRVLFPYRRSLLPIVSTNTRFHIPGRRRHAPGGPSTLTGSIPRRRGRPIRCRDMRGGTLSAARSIAFRPRRQARYRALRSLQTHRTHAPLAADSVDLPVIQTIVPRAFQAVAGVVEASAPLVPEARAKRNSVPSRHIACRMIASLRATAMTAFRCPRWR